MSTLNNSMGQVSMQPQSSPAQSTMPQPMCEEEDIFFCGKCKQQFNNLQIFLYHKRQDCVMHMQNTIPPEQHLNQSSNPPILPASNSYHATSQSQETMLLLSSNPGQIQQSTSQPASVNNPGMRNNSHIPCTNRHSHYPAPSMPTSGYPIQQPTAHLMATNNIVNEEQAEGMVLTDDLLMTTNHEYHGATGQSSMANTNMECGGNRAMSSYLQQISSATPQSPPAMMRNVEPQQLILLPPQNPPMQINTQQPINMQQNTMEVPNNPLAYNSQVHYTDYHCTPAATEVPQVNKPTTHEHEKISNTSTLVTILPRAYNTTTVANTQPTVQAVQPNNTQYMTNNTPFVPEPTNSSNTEANQSNGNVPLTHPPSSTDTASSSSEPKKKGSKFRCQYCERTFKRNFDLKQHVRSHTGEKPYQCIACGRAFSQKSNVKKHMSTHKVWPKPTDDHTAVDESTNPDGSNRTLQKEYKCSYCAMSFPSYLTRKSHLIEHKDKQVYKCVMENCDKTFAHLELFVEHIKVHENELTYRCHHCHENFTSLYDLGLHQYQSHLNERDKKQNSLKKYKCKLCSAKYATPEALRSHTFSDPHSYSCTRCNEIFTSEKLLHQHDITQHPSTSQREQSLHKCNICNKTMSSLYYLRKHELIHTNERPYKCRKCQATFNRKDNLRRHMLQHDSGKLLRCPLHDALECKKVFKRADKLKAHIISHSGIKTHQCSYCPKKYTRKSYKITHEKTHFLGFCKSCNFQFKSSRDYKTHTCSTDERNDKGTSSSTTKRKSSKRKRKISSPKSDTTTTNIQRTIDANFSEGQPMWAIRSGTSKRKNSLNKNNPNFVKFSKMLMERDKQNSSKTSEETTEEADNVTSPSSEVASVDNEIVRVEITLPDDGNAVNQTDS